MSRFLINTNLGILVGVCLLVQLIINVVFIVPDFIPEEAYNNETVTKLLQKKGGDTLLIFQAVLIIPILETLIFQFSIIKFIQLVIRPKLINFWISVFASALCFGLVHNFSLYYQIITFFVGLLYAFIFYISQYRKDLPALLIITIIHASWNFSVFILNKLIHF